MKRIDYTLSSLLSSQQIRRAIQKNTNKTTYFTSLMLALFLSSVAMAQKPNPTKSFEISLKADEQIETVYKDNQRINVANGMPIAMYGLNVATKGSSPEDRAWNYLLENGKALGLSKRELKQLQHHATRSTNAGTVVRYRQFYNDIPVNKSEITISISPQNKVVYVANNFSYHIEKNVPAATPVISLTSAKSAAKRHLPANKKINYEDARLMIYQNNRMTRLAYEITLLSEGEWHVFVDAQTGEIFKAEDQAYYYCNHNDKKHDHTSCSASHDKSAATTVVDGTGTVFDPDPLSSNQVAYGGGYVDNADVNSPELQASLFSVTLNDIEFANGVYTLRGPYAEVIDFDAPTTGLFEQASPDFTYNREDQAFEAVNTYYHIDYLMRYINLTLGCDVMPYQYTGGVQYDPHGANGADNSYYTSGAGRLSFGEGCVDDAEDSDVIHHELGHGLHDWVTSGGLSQVDGLSEGCGDYVAQSYNRSLGNWTSADPAYNWVFNWDGHNECWGGRSTAYNAVYPDDLGGSIHTNGQMWASTLMTIWDAIGQQKTDKIFYEGLGMTNGSSSQNDAANAVYQAAINLNYTTEELTIINNLFSARGYTMPILASDPDDAGISAVLSPTGQYCDGQLEAIVTLTNYGTNDLTSVDITYDIDGANPVTANWSGTLASGASVDYALGTINVTSGSYTFNAYTNNPNGTTDTNSTNDAANSNFSVSIGGQVVGMELITDTYASETSWELTDANNNVLASGDNLTNSTTYNEAWCLGNGCYTWTLFDSYGDGICCGYGNGSFTITNNTDGTEYGTGGTFTDTAVVEFCVTGGTCAEGDNDGDGVCGEVDCDDNDANIGGPGTACDDGNPDTVNDVLDTNCNCAGQGATPCVNGDAGGYPCNDIDLIGFMSLADMGCAEANDIWGWTDPQTGKEYAIFGCTDRTTFIDISTPTVPVLVGSLLTHTTASDWRDMKVYADHAFIVSEASGHGMQVFDLNQLRDIAAPPATFTATAHLGDLGGGLTLSNSHNIVINEASGFAYTVGNNICSGGLTTIDISNPTSPVFTGCFSSDGYTHDAQCVNYIGPDGQYTGQEICFNSNENTLTIVDVTDKTDMTQISRTGYAGQQYTHQGWLTDNQEYFLMNDELDESSNGHNTRTHIWDVRDLDSPVYMGYYEAPVGAIDHNLYIIGNLAYLANYRSGLRILDISDIANANLVEIAYFDTYPASDSPNFNSAWSSYPYFASGNIIVSDIEQGLFILKHNNGVDACVDNGGDADGDGVCADVDCDDNNASVRGPGSACDDGDACTTGDVLDANCNCAGTFADADNDGICDANDTCPNLDDNLIGTACDDGDACTTGDVWGADCNCAGTFQDADNDGVCDADDACPNFDDNLIGTACDDGDACTTGDVWGADCNCAGTFQDADNDSICDADDTCPNLNDALIGTPCDDGDPNTTDDTWGADCACTGIPVAGCTTTTTPGGNVESPDGTQNCRTFTLGGEHQDISFALSGINSKLNGKPSSRYIDLVTVQYVDANGTTQTHGTYTANGTVDIAGPATALIVCIEDNDGSLGASVRAEVGTITSCVDGDNPPNCTPDATCDDGDACTTGDVYDANCNCAGTYTDADGDGVCVGDDPNDNDPCVPNACGGCTTYNSESFETDWGIWNDGGSDVASDAVYANTGAYAVRLRDNSGQASSIYTDVLDLSAYSSLDISFSFFASSMETGEDFLLEISTDGGATYSTVQSWVSGTDFTNGTRYDEAVTVSGLSSTTVFRIRCDASANNDRVYIDDVVIEDCSGEERLESNIENLNIYPNPSDTHINVDLSQVIQTLDSDNIEVNIFSLNGKLVYQNEMQVTDMLHLNITALSSAQMYLLHLRTDDGRMFRGKFVKF